MRKALIIALGLASLGAIASVQPALAVDLVCQKFAAYNQSIQCISNSQGQKVCKVVPGSFDAAYNRCVAAKAAKAAQIARATGQSNALTTAKPGPDIQQGKKTHPN